MNIAARMELADILEEWEIRHSLTLEEAIDLVGKQLECYRKAQALLKEEEGKDDER